jgi:uncharacterized PurR-regulated membrane protein YhhQ (DUF165 family)
MRRWPKYLLLAIQQMHQATTLAELHEAISRFPDHSINIAELGLAANNRHTTRIVAASTSARIQGMLDDFYAGQRLRRTKPKSLVWQRTLGPRFGEALDSNGNTSTRRSIA